MIAKAFVAVLVLSNAPAFQTAAEPVDLLKRYPTTLTNGDTAQPRKWEFAQTDIYRLSRFNFDLGTNLHIEISAADIGIGHCSDGAVWAVVIPRDSGALNSSANATPENIAHVWLRFHPSQLNHLFPLDTVSSDGSKALAAQMRAIAGTKMPSSWQAGGQALIPEPKDLTVDVDTKAGPRRFFMVDTEAGKAEYVSAFARRAVKLPPPITKALAEEAFDELWQGFDRDYALFALRPEVAWGKLREQYRPRAIAAQSAYEFADVCAEMLKPLRDLHIWLKVAGADVPVFNRPRASNSNPSAHRHVLGALNANGRDLEWAVTDDKVGYFAIYGWNQSDLPNRCQEVLEEMRDTRGLIMDVRLNGGGSEDLAMEVAGRFLPRQFVYAYSQFRNGPAHTNLTQKIPREVSPRGPWRYNRPVVLLIGQKCMSSNESFIAMMSGDPDLTTMGDRTCGSSGNPRMLNLPMDITVSIPRWIDYLPDGMPLDERGFQPQVLFDTKPGAFEGNRDDLLTAALERLQKVPLPEKPIEGPAFGGAEASGPQELRVSPHDLADHSADIKQEAQDTSRPKVISVSPAPDAKGVAPATALRIRFDRPMDPLSLKLQWEAGGFYDCEFPNYDSNRYEFTIPIHLAPDALHQVVINPPFIKQELSEARKQWPLDGFQSTDQKLAGLYAWRFNTKEWPAASIKNAPKVVSVSPKSGTQAAQITLVDIQFDQPMAPTEMAYPYVVPGRGERESASLLQCVQYEAAKRTFHVALALPAKKKTRFKLAGFRSATGIHAEAIPLEYDVKSDKFSPTQVADLEAAARDKRLLDFLGAMKEKRSQLISLVEQVQTLSLTENQGLFTGLDSKSALFKWSKPDRFYADASQEMLSCKVFRLGCDGENWWWHIDEKLEACPVSEMHQRNVALCDPFDLISGNPAAAAAETHLAWSGTLSFAGRDMVAFTSWDEQGRTRWFVNPSTHLPEGVEQCAIYGAFRTRFLYRHINETIPANEFAVPKIPGITPDQPEPLDDGYTNRFVNLRDGSDGRMSVRWGKFGPKGRSSSGLN